ncbi:hypothetical protein KY346_05155 [Candidatus Woesearchaeota archaeon]|nr:hypothetical protein [Candidatus Woesearchaeota archaeon]
MGRLRDLGLAALAFILLGGPGSKVIAEDPEKPKKPAKPTEELVTQEFPPEKEKKKVVKKIKPWKEQVAMELEQHVSSEYKSTVVKDLRVIVVNDGVAHARASIDGVDYTFKEHAAGITAILRTDKRLIVLSNHDKKDGFEDASWIGLDGKNIPWDYTLPQRKDHPEKCKKDYHPDGQERMPPGEAYEKELKSVLLIDFSRRVRAEFSKVFKDIDLKKYDALLEDIIETNKLHRKYIFTIPLDSRDTFDLIFWPMRVESRKFFLKQFVKNIKEMKEPDWYGNIVCEYAAKREGEKDIVLFRVNKEEKGEKYTLLMRTKRDGNSSPTKYVLYPNKEITITKKFGKTHCIEKKKGYENEIVTASIKYTPTKEGGVLEHKNIDLDNAKRLFDFMNPIFKAMKTCYDANKVTK